MTTTNQTVRDIMLPLGAFPRMQEHGTVHEAIGQLRSFCPIGSSGPCGFSELMVVDAKDYLIGRVTQAGILRVLFSSLLDPLDIKQFEGKTSSYMDLTTLLGEVLIREGVNHLNATLTRVIEKNIRTIAPDADLVQAMAMMVIAKETVLPVTEKGRLLGIVNLTEVFGAIGDKLVALNSK